MCWLYLDGARLAFLVGDLPLDLEALLDLALLAGIFFFFMCNLGRIDFVVIKFFLIIINYFFIHATTNCTINTNSQNWQDEI